MNPPQDAVGQTGRDRRTIRDGETGRPSRGERHQGLLKGDRRKRHVDRGLLSHRRPWDAAASRRAAIGSCTTACRWRSTMCGWSFGWGCGRARRGRSLSSCLHHQPSRVSGRWMALTIRGRKTQREAQAQEADHRHVSVDGARRSTPWKTRRSVVPSPSAVPGFRLSAASGLRGARRAAWIGPDRFTSLATTKT